MSFGIVEVAGGRLSPPFMPTKTHPYVLGRLLHFPTDEVREMTDIVQLPFDVELLSVAVGCSRYFPTDYWGMEINGTKVFETIYTKDIPEGAYLMAVVPVKAGDKLLFRYYNAEGRPKHVWFNYQFLR